MIDDVHDNFIYAYSVLCEEGRIILHTHFCDGDANEFGDVVFTEVEIHHFECVLSSNIIFAIEAVSVEEIINEHKELFVRLKKHGWPKIDYSSIEQLIQILDERQLKGFVINSSCGLYGWVLAKEMRFIERPDLKDRQTINARLIN
jgi:hypothetical protein